MAIFKKTKVFRDLALFDGTLGREDCQIGWQIFVGNKYKNKSILDVGSGLALSKDRMHFVIDSIALLVDQSKTRNFQKWPILGQYVWPNYFVGNTYQEEVNYLKNWVNNRIDYLDIVWKIDSSNIAESPNSLFSFKPNPAADNVQIQFYKEFDKDISIQLFNIKGQKFEPKYSILNKNIVNLDISMLPIGLFLLQVNDGTNSFVEKIVKQ